MISARRRGRRGPEWVTLLVAALVACGPDGPSAPDAGSDSSVERTRCEPLPPSSDCHRSEECAGGVCAATDFSSLADQEPVRLACASSAGGVAGVACGSQEDCATGLCSVSGACLEPCGADADCDSESWCERVMVRGVDAYTHPVSACVSRLERVSGVSFSESAVEAGSSTVTLDYPGESALYLFDGFCSEPAPVGSLEDGAGRVLFDVEAIGQTPPLNPIATVFTPLVVQVPSGSPGALMPGAMSLHFTESVSNRLNLTRILGEPTGRTLDLSLYYVSLPTLAPEGERGPERVAEALGEVERIFAPAGITLGVVQQHVIAGELGDRLTVVDFDAPGVSDEFPELLRLSAGGRGAHVPIFLVRSVDFAIARSGGIPGPLGRHGTGGSGIAISTGVLDTPRELGHAIAHEIGHFLGLYHVVESRGTVLEALEDTPICTADADGDGFRSAEECEGMGAENLMFWSEGGVELSSEQIAVLQRAPILR